ncbi:hypothetical protein T4E_2176 [Trichinella pseudospiralis]|uniref:Uncharacterized protein n=1 Tax=Trichinella pseudospiralis TaxID=6337 RepID=A0A0V0YNX3_TRIPS|nr:hypothetical protein T4E_2176 [Trichinella pseudospiralis]
MYSKNTSNEQRTTAGSSRTRDLLGRVNRPRSHSAWNSCLALTVNGARHPRESKTLAARLTSCRFVSQRLSSTAGGITKLRRNWAFKLKDTYVGATAALS